MHSLIRSTSRVSVIAIAFLVTSVLTQAQPSDAVIDVPVQGKFRVTVPAPKPQVSEFRPADAPKPEVVKSEKTDHPLTTSGRDVSTDDTSPAAIDPEALVSIVGPTEAKIGAYFIVSVKVPPPGENVLTKVTTKAPDGAMPAIELAGKNPGELVYLFQQVTRGQYVFNAAAQISVDRAEGFDPHDEDALTVEVVDPAPPTPPDPTPPGPQPPGPTPSPAPFPSDGLAILITYSSEAANELTAGQRGIIYGAETRALLTRICPVGPDGVTHEFRIWDDESDVSLAPEKWQKAMAVPRQSPKWVVISNGKRGYSGPLPSDPEAFKALVQPFVE